MHNQPCPFLYSKYSHAGGLMAHTYRTYARIPNYIQLLHEEKRSKLLLQKEGDYPHPPSIQFMFVLVPGPGSSRSKSLF